MDNIAYIKAIELLKKSSSEDGFLASATNVANYQRVWARDGVICGLAALASGDDNLIQTFKKTLETLAANQHENGTIPSNVHTGTEKTEVSYGGLAGRVDAISWFIIGICQYGYYMQNPEFVEKHEQHIHKCLQLMEAWEFNNKHLMYVPLSGNWADEYVTDGYVLFDQVLRVWALRSYNHYKKSEILQTKILNIIAQIEVNFTDDLTTEKYHEKAFNEIKISEFMPASFSPAGYKNYFDAFGNSVALLMNIGSETFQEKMLNHCINLSNHMKSQLLPAFWPPIQPTDLDWNLLKNNCKYEFRNFPNEFHNGGTWAMVNGFFGLALVSKNKTEVAKTLLDHVNVINEIEDFGFYENFNSETEAPNGVKYCAWSAAATIMLHQSVHNNFKLLQ